MEISSKDSINELKKNTLTTCRELYQQMVHDIILERIVNKGLLDKGTTDKDFLIKLIRLNSNLSLMIIEACIIFRADLVASDVSEKRFLLKRMVMTIHEGYKYIFGFTKKETFCERFLMTMKPQNEEVVKCIEKARKQYIQKYGNNFFKSLRDVAKHYSYDSLEFYNCVKSLSERSVGDMFCCFMAFSQPLFSLTINELQEKTGLWLMAVNLQNIETEKIESFFDDKLMSQVDHSISKYGGFIDRINSTSIKSMKLFEDLQISSDNSIRPFLSDNVGTHIFYIVMDILCALKAFANSDEYYEQSMHLAYLRLSIHEGFKKLYGFNDTDKDKSFWTRFKEDYSDVLNSMDTDIKNLEINLERLKKYDYVSSEEVVIFTHFGELKRQIIPYEIVLNFFKKNKETKNFAIILDVIKVLNGMLPIITRLMDENAKLVDFRTRKNIDEWKKKFDDLFDKILSLASSDYQDNLKKMRNNIAFNLETLKDLMA